MCDSNGSANTGLFVKDHLGPDGMRRLSSRHQYPCTDSRLYTLPSHPSLSFGHDGAHRHCTQVQDWLISATHKRRMFLPVCAEAAGCAGAPVGLSAASPGQVMMQTAEHADTIQSVSL